MIPGTLQEHFCSRNVTSVVVHLCMVATIHFNLSRNALSFFKEINEKGHIFRQLPGVCLILPGWNGPPT
jgi:hypothetical protein